MTSQFICSEAIFETEPGKGDPAKSMTVLYGLKTLLKIWVNRYWYVIMNLILNQMILYFHKLK